VTRWNRPPTVRVGLTREREGGPRIKDPPLLDTLRVGLRTVLPLGVESRGRATLYSSIKRDCSQSQGGERTGGRCGREGNRCCGQPRLPYPRTVPRGRKPPGGPERHPPERTVDPRIPRYHYGSTGGTTDVLNGSASDLPSRILVSIAAPPRARGLS
jgi:hypothetical protein